VEDVVQRKAAAQVATAKRFVGRAKGRAGVCAQGRPAWKSMSPPTIYGSEISS